MLLTIVFILFAMAVLAALEIMLFWQLSERDDRRRSGQRALGRDALPARIAAVPGTGGAGSGYTPASAARSARSIGEAT